MENQDTNITVLKVDDPEKLTVLHASSTEDEIRFWLNKTQYYGAALEDGKFSIAMKTLKEEEELEKKSTFAIIKENFKEFLGILLISIAFGGICFILSMAIAKLLDSLFLYLFFINTTFFLISLLNVVIVELKTLSPSIKSKHSAEHMMVNFLESNRRLPKSIEEVKTCSRFSDECGSREQIEGIAEEFISKIIASILTVIAIAIYSAFFENEIVELLICFGVYYLTSFIVKKILKENEKIEFIVKPIRKVLTNIVQCANTTKKVEDKDIVLAYCAARLWVQTVYPEYYNEDEDVFIQNLPKNKH